MAMGVIWLRSKRRAAGLSALLILLSGPAAVAAQARPDAKRAATAGWWHGERSGVAFAGEAPVGEGVVVEAVHAWQEAVRQFPPRRVVMPQVVVAGTTEQFRRLSGAPGWDLASTRGATVVLQPERVFAAHCVGVSATLRHEMLHVAVEASAGAGAPLWLREGLVEALAGEAVAARPALSAAKTEQLLRGGARSRAESEAAARAAGERVRGLVGRYGLAAVRGWLERGGAVPVE